MPSADCTAANHHVPQVSRPAGPLVEPEQVGTWHGAADKNVDETADKTVCASVVMEFPFGLVVDQNSRTVGLVPRDVYKKDRNWDSSPIKPITYVRPAWVQLAVANLPRV